MNTLNRTLDWTAPSSCQTQPHPNDEETAVVTSDSPPFSIVGRGTTRETPHQPLQGGLRW